MRDSSREDDLWRLVNHDLHEDYEIPTPLDYYDCLGYL